MNPKKSIASLSVLFVLLISSATLVAQTELHRAAAHGNLPKVIQLVKEGQPLNAPDSLQQTPLMYAVLGGNIKVVKWLLKKGAEPDLQNYFGETALMLAVQKDAPQMVKLLMKKKANIHKRDRKGWNALMLSKSARISELLMRKVAAVNYATPGKGITALMIAAQEGNLPVVKVLLTSKADVEKAAADGKKAIDFARENGHTEIAELIQRFSYL